ncbi:response regulator, partial [Acidobacteria bacterium ACD]|nr:response regulator [Acidobacteria bacterium ACD]
MTTGDGPARVLVVDDNESNREVLARRLSVKGYVVETAEDGERALALVEAAPPDLILLDVMMPGLSGFDVLDRLRKSHEAGDLPVIMATARDASEDVVRALTLGANDYVTKPLDFPIVLARVRTHLELKRARQELRDTAGRLREAQGR